MSQSDYYGGYNNAPTSQQASYNPAPMPPGLPPMPPAPMSGMPAFPPGFPMPPPPMTGQSATSGNHQQHGSTATPQFGATQPQPNTQQNQQFNQQSQYGQQQSQQQQSKPGYDTAAYGQQNNFNAQNKNQSDFSVPAKNENRDVIENQIFITNLNTSTPPTQDDLKERFGSIGIIKMDKKTRQPRIKVWPEKGCASVTYEDPSAASAAISWFSGKEFAGSVITVELATKSEEWSGGRRGERSGGRGGGRGGYGGDRGSRGGRDFDRGGRDRSPRRRSRSRSPNRGGGQKEGDWTCGECSNSNFARRTECNRCKAPKPGGGGGGGGGGGYGGERRGSDRGGYDRRDRDRRDDRRDDRRGDRRDDRRGDDRRSSFGGRGGGRGGGGNVRDGDWPCPKCGVNNFASRSECFKCHASK